jgi:hypothetical protein
MAAQKIYMHAFSYLDRRWELPIPIIIDVDGGEIVGARQLRQRPVRDTRVRPHDNINAEPCPTPAEVVCLAGLCDDAVSGGQPDHLPRQARDKHNESCDRDTFSSSVLRMTYAEDSRWLLTV